MLPILKLYALEGARDSTINPDPIDDKNIYDHDGLAFKVFFYADLLENQEKMIYV